jgi:hypothetical protein
MDVAGNKVAKTEIAMIKVVAPSMACQVIDWAMQAHGGGGMCDDFPLAYAYAGARTLRFADGASQNLLFTVYSDGVCQVNGKFVFLRSPDGNAEAIYQLLRDAVV